MSGDTRLRAAKTGMPWRNWRQSNVKRYHFWVGLQPLSPGLEQGLEPIGWGLAGVGDVAVEGLIVWTIRTV